MVVSVAEAIKCVSLAAGVADVPLQGEGLLAVSEGLVMVPEQGMMPAGVVENPCLATAVTGGAEQGDGLLVVQERFCEAVLMLKYAAQLAMNLALAGRVA